MASPDLAHPYFPEALLLPDYTPNTIAAASLLAIFSTGCAIILAAAYLVNDDLKLSDRLTVLWFIMCKFSPFLFPLFCHDDFELFDVLHTQKSPYGKCGAIHCFFEGYWVLNHDRMPSRMDIFGQLWKEYALSDSRYMFCEPLLLCMEILSVSLLGPLSFLTAWLITTTTDGSGYRHSFQALVSIGHLYSNLLYFATSLYDDHVLGKQYYRPEPLYFWAYFVGMNSIWLVVPGVLLYSSMRVSAQAFAEAEESRRKVRALQNVVISTKVSGTGKKEA